MNQVLTPQYMGRNYMKLLKYGIVGIGTLMLVLSAMSVSAETIADGTGDVWHWAQTGTTWAWGGNVGDKPNIDITDISYTVTGNTLTLSMTVEGTIQSTDKIGYFIYYNTTDTSYWLSWANGEGGGLAMSTAQGGIPGAATNVTASGNTFNGTFDILGDASKVAFWGWAFEYTNVTGGMTSEWWGDWAPDTQFPYQVANTNPGSSTSQPKTPGFEAVLAIAAIGSALIILKRRK